MTAEAESAILPDQSAEGSTPRYATGVDLSQDGPAGELVRSDARRLLERLVAHWRATSTDQAEGQWREPVANYRDKALWRRELQLVHHRVPLAVALSCEVPTPGSYKALDVVGTPVLITRGNDGAVRALVNACRHRGAQLLPDGTGTTRRITCPYHAWTYDLGGCLQALYGDRTFGDVDRAGRSLVQLPVQERAGIVFVSLDRSAGPDSNAGLDLDGWLGDLLPLLEGLGLASAHVHSSRELPGPNWKVTLDGYLEGYHFAPLHRTTVFKTNLSNMATFDRFGAHARVSFALRPIAEAAHRPVEDLDPVECVGPIYFLFPGLAIAGGWRNNVAVSIVLPGRTVAESLTQQLVLLRRPAADPEEVAAADVTSDWLYNVVLDEDYATGFGVQRGLEALSGTDFLFGRNEPGVQHFHRVLQQYVP